MLYRQIAQSIEELSSAPRSCKADLCSRLIVEMKPELLCPTVRLLLGQLWPPWEGREMGVGPEGVAAALEEISEENISLLRDRMGEMGLVAEAALAEKGQHSLSSEPLQSMSVYEQLRRISLIRGKDSEQRKNALLRGLFQDASPLEGKYIARTVLGNMLAGTGDKTMLAAFALAFCCDPDQIQRAYSLLPDPGKIAIMAAGNHLERASIQPGIPIKPMTLCALKAEDLKTVREVGEESVGWAVLPRYHALRVQVHNTGDGAYIFSSRQKNITTSLNGLAQRLSGMDDEFIIDADLIGFHEGKMCTQSEMLRYINRRRLSRRSSISPALLAYDLIYISGEDTTSLPFQERRKRMLKALGEPRSMPFQGISATRECIVLEKELKKDSIQSHLDQMVEEGGVGLMVRSLLGLYRPGECSRCDFFVGREMSISAVIVRAEWGRRSSDQIFSRFLVALREGDDLVPVGWIGGQSGQKDILELDRQLKALAREWDDTGACVNPQVLLKLKIQGARRNDKGYAIVRPQVLGIDLFASWEDADELTRLFSSSGR